MVMFSTTHAPEQAIVFHRVGVAIAAATTAANKRADERLEWALRCAAELRRLAPLVEELMSLARPANELRGPQAARELRALCPLLEAEQLITATFPGFIEEHDAILEPRLKEIIARFVRWIPERGRELQRRVSAFEQQVTADLEADAEKLREFAGTWSSVDADGLEPG